MELGGQPNWISRRKVLTFIGCVLIAFALADFWDRGGADPLLLAIRAGWAALFLLAATVLREDADPTYVLCLHLLAAASPLCMGGVIWQTGGPSSPLWAGLVVLPLGLVAFTRWQVGAAVTGALTAAGVAVGLALLPHELRTLQEAWLRAVVVGGVGVLAVYAATLQRRMRDEQRAALSARDQAQNRLMDSERLLVLGQLAAGVAHEINNPLAYAGANLRCLAEELTERSLGEDELRQLVCETEHGLERIAQIVSELRSVARTDAALDEPFLCSEPVEEALRVASVRLRPRIELDVELEHPGPEVRGSRRLLAQVLINLLINAADALDTARAAPKVRVRMVSRGGQVALSVEDNGPGLSAEVQRRMFEPFFTTKQPGKGTGLGLPLSQQYVQRLGGTLLVESSPGKGARFTVMLPIQEEEASPAGALSPGARGAGPRHGDGAVLAGGAPVALGGAG